jgi:hypothetical protein
LQSHDLISLLEYSCFGLSWNPILFILIKLKRIPEDNYLSFVMLTSTFVYNLLRQCVCIEALYRNGTVLFVEMERTLIQQESRPTNLWDKSKPSVIYWVLNNECATSGV